MTQPLRWDVTLRAAIKVCGRLGTWVLYEVRDAEDLDELIGYLRYCVEDLQRHQQRASDIRRRDRLGDLVGFWRRAIRWVSSLDPEHASAIATRVLAEIETNPTYRDLVYVAPDCGHPSLRTKDKAPRPSRRPKAKRAKAKPMQPCGACRGLGLVEARA